MGWPPWFSVGRIVELAKYICRRMKQFFRLRTATAAQLTGADALHAADSFVAKASGT